MFTANTMSSAIEAMGLSLPGSSTMAAEDEEKDRKSTRLNSSHANISYAVFCLKKKKKKKEEKKRKNKKKIFKKKKKERENK